MMFKKRIAFIALLITVLTHGQEKDNILFKIDDHDVYSSEFIRVFQKNRDIIVDNEQKNFDDYFNLFVDFKLKLRQAYELELDTSSTYISELEKYREQLISPYLQNNEAIEKLIKESYDRTVKEVSASHILIRVSVDAKPKDTLIAYQKITEARNKIISGISFESVARQFSEDPSVSSNEGNLGYFSAFSMVYSFENAAYSTKVGDVSKPFRTQFGYHIVKVNDFRNSRGEIQIAHIMVKKTPTDTAITHKNILDIYNKLKQGGDFSKIAQEHSDDLNSAKKGGLLPRFGSGKMIEPFDSIAFKLENLGDLSKPFESNYGWHVLKLIKKYPIQNLDALHDELENKIKNGSRSIFVQKYLANKLEKKYHITENLEVISFFYKADQDKMKSEKMLLQIENEIYTANDFNIYILDKKNKNIGELYDTYRNEKIINYYKSHLEETNKEFAAIYKEYKDGLILFELLQNKIWIKSEKDTIGLRNYYDHNKNKYIWKTRGDLLIASCTSLDKANWVKNYLDNDKSIDEIKNLINEGATVHVLFSNGILEEGSSKLPIDFKIKHGVSEIYNTKDNEFTIIKVNEIIPETIKKYEETRGEVINDYQKYLEKIWIESLHQKYQVKINKRILKKLKSQYADL